MYQSCWLGVAHNRRYRYQRASPVCCVKGSLTAVMHVLCFDVELLENGIGFLFFTLLLPTEPSSSQNLTIAF